jgi:acyclic terpene utilization AtuA family protein
MTMAGKTLRLGAGAAWWGDRVDPAAQLARDGALDYLCFETMAEATMSSARVRMRADRAYPGYDTYLDERMYAVLASCRRNGTRIISNQGWANPLAAGARIAALARELGIQGLRIATVTGVVPDESVKHFDGRVLETGVRFQDLPFEIVSVDAYLGAAPIIEALKQGADVVVTSRVADPSLYVAPIAYEFGWSLDDWDRLGKATVVGHLMECAAQCTGGYFADPGYKEVPGLARLGFPIAIVDGGGDAVVTKLPTAGGLVTTRTLKEQLLYEIHDPSAYVTPDVVADFTHVRFEEIGKDRVAVRGGAGSARTGTLKACVGCHEGYVAEDWFFFAGPGALEKAKLAREVLEERFRIVDLRAEDVRIDFLGVNAVHGELSPAPVAPPYEIGVRVAARARDLREVTKVVREVDGMAVCGLAGTGKRVPPRERTREVIGLHSILLPRDEVGVEVRFVEV